MGILTKPYTFIKNIVVDASEVNRNFDDIYGTVNGSLDSGNIATTYSPAASQVNVNDTAGAITGTSVEAALNELANAISLETLVEMSEGLVGYVGEESQAFAGHKFSVEEPGVTSSNVIVLYNFDDSASKTTDEKGIYPLTVSGADVVSGIMGLSGGALLFTSATSDYARQATLMDSATSGYCVDFWAKPEQITASTENYLFDKNNSAANHRAAAYITNTGTLVFAHTVAGTAYTAQARHIFMTGTENDWVYIVCAQDSSNGVRLWVNKELVAMDISGTNSMNSGNDSDFFIGCNYTAAAPYSGYIGNFRIRHGVVITQKDVDLGYATKIDAPALAADNQNYDIRVNVQTCGNAEMEYQEQLVEVARNSANIYVQGGQFSPEDRRSIQATN